jgi:hypothetical protein
MATRSRIGIELKDGSILSAYHHWDGYPQWLGKKLVKNFETRGKVSALIDGGDMSSCWTNAGFSNETLPETGPLYYSARGEDCPPRLDKDMEEFFSAGEEYSYIFTNGQWVCYDMHEFEPQIAPELVEIPAE